MRRLWSTGRAQVMRLPAWARVALGLLLITAFSAYLRSHALDAKFWIDEGLSAGIADRPLGEIPGVLRQDGSPPLYYMVLSVWIDIVGGTGETRLHLLSLGFALLCVPAAFWAGEVLFDRRAAWAAAGLAAVNPFLTFYAQEARMYSLVALLGMLSLTLFTLAYARRDRRALPFFAIATALLLYTHNWGLFFAAGMFVTAAWFAYRAQGEERRALLRDGLLGFGAVFILYLPWVPTLLYQAGHTGAPWSNAPKPVDILNGLSTLGGGEMIAFAGAVVAFAGIATLLRGPRTKERDAILAVLIAGLAGLAFAFVASQISPAWASRYFAVFVAPVILVFAVGLTRYATLGLIVLALVLYISADTRERNLRGKGDSWRVATALKQDYTGTVRSGDAALVRDGDTVLMTHPEAAPVMRYYFRLRFPQTELRWLDALGPIKDPGFFDWRDAEDRLRATRPRRSIERLAGSMQPGEHLIVFVPIIRTARWVAPWTRLVKRRSLQWRNGLNHSPYFELEQTVPKFRPRGLPRGVRALVYERVEDR